MPTFPKHGKEQRNGSWQVQFRKPVYFNEVAYRAMGNLCVTSPMKENKQQNKLKKPLRNG